MSALQAPMALDEHKPLIDLGLEQLEAPGTPELKVGHNNSEDLVNHDLNPQTFKDTLMAE